MKQDNKNDDTDCQSGDDFEKSRVDAPPLTNTQQNPYKMNLAGS